MPADATDVSHLPAWAREMLNSARVARLATVGNDESPHLVPICFVLDRTNVYTVVDDKPKRHRRLQRLVNLESRPRAALLVDLYREDWGRLAWVRVDARASILESGREHARALELLIRKYPQYRRMRLEKVAGPVIRLHPYRISCWRAEDT